MAELSKAVSTMSDSEKIAVGHKLRKITDKMNLSCEPFNDIDVKKDKSRDRCWGRYPNQFQRERIAYIAAHDYGENVFVHGDLNGDNILLTPNNDLFVIDFADAVLAPKVHEHALLALESGLDGIILRGYFDGYTVDVLAEDCFNGLLLADYDDEMVEAFLGEPDRFQSIDDLRKGLLREIGERFV